MTRERFISEVRACQGQLRRFLASLCGDAVLADDIAQEALVRAYVMSDGFKGHFKAWLFKIAVLICRTASLYWVLSFSSIRNAFNCYARYEIPPKRKLQFYFHHHLAHMRRALLS